MIQKGCTAYRSHSLKLDFSIMGQLQTMWWTTKVGKNKNMDKSLFLLFFKSAYGFWSTRCILKLASYG